MLCFAGLFRNSLKSEIMWTIMNTPRPPHPTWTPSSLIHHLFISILVCVYEIHLVQSHHILSIPIQVLLSTLSSTWHSRWSPPHSRHILQYGDDSTSLKAKPPHEEWFLHSFPVCLHIKQYSPKSLTASCGPSISGSVLPLQLRGEASVLVEGLVPWSFALELIMNW